MPSEPRITVLHYTGSRRDDSGVHAVIRQLAANPQCRAILGVASSFEATKQPRIRLWRGPHLADDSISLGNLWPAFRVAWRIRPWLRRSPNRVFHGHSRAGLLVGLWLRLLGMRRIVVSVHCYGRWRAFYRLVRRVLGARLVWLTPAMKRHYGLTDLSWTDCMPNGLDAPLPNGMHRGPGPGRELRLGGAGALVAWKRWDLVLEALARLPADARVRFIHIGGALETPESRQCERELQAMTLRLCLQNRVEWRGWQPSSAGLLGEVDAVVVPSDGEPFSMIALEALFAGRPVIATRGGGPEDFIIEGENGWLVSQGEAAALSACIRKCLEPEPWAGLRISPGHLRRLSVPETLAVRWTEIYRSLEPAQR